MRKKNIIWKIDEQKPVQQKHSDNEYFCRTVGTENVNQFYN